MGVCSGRRGFQDPRCSRRKSDFFLLSLLNSAPGFNSYYHLTTTSLFSNNIVFTYYFLASEAVISKNDVNNNTISNVVTDYFE